VRRHCARMKVWDECMLNVLNRCLRLFSKLVNDNCTNNRKKNNPLQSMRWNGKKLTVSQPWKSQSSNFVKKNSESPADNNTLVQVS
jgi:hypothetical protein